MNKTRNVYLMYAIIFLQGFVFYGPVAALFRQARGLSMSEIFIIESISCALIIVLEIPWGWIADRIGYKKTLLIVNVLFFLSKIVFYMAHSFWGFLLERILLSAVFSGLSGCDTALIYGSIDESETQSIFGRYSAFGTLGFMIASVLSTFVIAVSFEFAAFLTIFPYGIAVVLTFFLIEVKNSSGERVSLTKNFEIAFSDKSILLFVFSIALISEVVQVVTVFLNQIQYLRSGIDPKYFGIIIAVIQCAKLISVKSKDISSKLGNLKTIGLFVGLITGGCVLLIATDNPWLSVGGVILIALSLAIIGPIDIDVKNQQIKSEDRATILSMYSMVGGLLASIGNIAVGAVADYSLQAGLAVCTLMGIASFVFLRCYSKANSLKQQIVGNDA